jgi:DNA-directed RNA polymerase subunit RPC12/RpoP
VYKCIKCGEILDRDTLDFSQSVKCPFCGGRVLIKVRPPISKKVEAK